ncbi:hypothetical protein KC327_g49 [Hortaea werneckii]|nr:hypothetical protein KC327_g49 [Hortaea werneckii]
MFALLAFFPRSSSPKFSSPSRLQSFSQPTTAPSSPLHRHSKPTPHTCPSSQPYRKDGAKRSRRQSARRPTS